MYAFDTRFILEEMTVSDDDSDTSDDTDEEDEQDEADGDSLLPAPAGENPTATPDASTIAVDENASDEKAGDEKVGDEKAGNEGSASTETKRAVPVTPINVSGRFRAALNASKCFPATGPVDSDNKGKQVEDDDNDDAFSVAWTDVGEDTVPKEDELDPPKTKSVGFDIPLEADATATPDQDTTPSKGKSATQAASNTGRWPAWLRGIFSRGSPKTPAPGPLGANTRIEAYMLDEGRTRATLMPFTDEEVALEYQSASKYREDLWNWYICCLTPQRRQDLDYAVMCVKQSSPVERNLVAMQVLNLSEGAPSPAVLFFMAAGENEVEPVYIIDHTYVLASFHKREVLFWLIIF